MSGSVKTLLDEDGKTILTINGKKFKVGKLKLKSVMRLLNLIGKFFVKQSKKFKDFKPGETNADDLLAIFEILDEKELAQAIAILLDTDDIEFCSEIEAEDFTELVVAICEHNNLERIVGNVTRVIGMIKSQTGKKTIS